MTKDLVPVPRLGHVATPPLAAELTAQIQGYRPGQLAAGQADSDGEFLELWLHGRSRHTQRAYAADAARFMTVVAGELRGVKLRDLQRYSDALAGLKPTTKGRMLASVKSLLSFGHRIGYLPFNVGAALRLPKSADELAARILPEEVILKLLGGERNPRNAALLRLLYVSGVRVSEACALRWRDLQPAAEKGTGQITTTGKGGKTRTIKLTARCWEALQSIRAAGGPDDSVFRSQHRGGRLDQSQVRRIVYAAAKRAGLKGLNVSPHWFRHAHASHALDRGAPIHLVQATLGHSSMATTGKYSHARPADSSARFLPA
jgi:integrase/recombinase XerD